MLKELFETSFYYTYPPKEGVTVNLREQEFIGDGCLVDEIACQGCVDKCNANPLAREQFRFYADKQTYVLSINKVVSFLDTDLGENCDYIIDNGKKICLIEMTCASRDYVTSKREKCRSQFWNTITILRNCYDIREHIEKEEKFVIFSWRETFMEYDPLDPIEVSIKTMTSMSDEVYSPDNESNFDNSFKYKEIRYPHKCII